MQISVRFTLILVGAVAFLVGSHEALPNVGRCTFMEYFCAARKCTTFFYKGLQKDPRGDCFTKFNQMKDCVVKVLKYCADSLTHSTIRRIVDQNFRSTECSEGPALIPSSSAASLPCSSSFVTKANACGRTFRQIFVVDKSNSSLCAEEAERKKCVKNLVDSDCTFSSADQEVLDLGFADYNPFCANNRDPGATGNDQCYGVEDINGHAGINPTAGFNTAASIKPGVMQALLLVFMSICSFFVF
ncbi:uncharacterized protein [Pocillopora verrucosa]|uniref:uncharacterized protein n=1 Tax=Pocillopora verrucosa TaxID=203993 RepID=UPI00333F857C